MEGGPPRARFRPAQVEFLAEFSRGLPLRPLLLHIHKKVESLSISIESLGLKMKEVGTVGLRRKQLRGE